MKSSNSYAMPRQPGTTPPPDDAIPTDLLIGETWIEGQGKKRFDVFNPSNGETLTTVADGTVEDGMRALAAAQKAAPGWAATSPRRRSEILHKCYDGMIANQDWLATLISLENGKALSDAKSEIFYAADFFRWYAEEGLRVLGELSMSPGGQNRILVQYQPIGISLLITPWNFPAAMATRKIAPALAAGCTCILKPAPETPLTAFAVAQIMLQAGVPPGVLNVVTTSTAGPVCDAILHDPRVRKLSFTGSTQVGRILLRSAADCVINCSMELGGNAPFLVFDDADLDEAIEGAMMAKMRNGGEACTAANRFYVQRGVAKPFAEKLVKRMGALKVGDGCAADTGLGPLITEKAARKVSSLVDRAIEQGAQPALGGKRMAGKGYFYPPTVLTDVPASAEILKDEIFGPVAPIVVFDTVEEAIRLANNTEYGLAAYLYSGDLKKGLQVAEKLEYGMVAINRGFLSDTAAPFGGVKQSGLGREGSHHGLIEFTEAKYIAVTW